MRGPSDGYAYNRIELEAIWAMPCDLSVLASDYEKPYEFHQHAAALPDNPQAKRDEEAVLLITRALTSCAINNPPREPEPCRCNDIPQAFREIP